MRGATHRLPGLVLTGHSFEVPVDPAAPDGECLTLYAREVVAPGREDHALPWLVFLQGGPGYGAPRPPAGAAWLPRALQEYRVLLLDQRGTGRSTPVLARTLAGRGDAHAQAAYLAHFRSDAIVADCEHVRRALLGDRPWTVLGQSYGGFCATRYLSAAPEGLEAVLITGGLPPLVASVDEVYRATSARVLEKNALYFARYPEDLERLVDLNTVLRAHDVRLPGGDRLTPERFAALGLAFGASDGFEAVHYLLEQAFVDGPAGREPGAPFLEGVEAALPFASHPLFAVLHEAAYCEGFASRWAAKRVVEASGDFPTAGDAPRFTGEMIFPWMFEQFGGLAPLRDAARRLAEREDWPALYDREVLAANRVPCAAAVYHDDMYVERELSLATARAIGGCRVWITNEFEHDGLRVRGDLVLDRLLALLGGRA